MPRLHPQAEQPNELFLKRTEMLQWVVSFGFLLVVMRLWNLQIMAGKEYQLLSRDNRIEPVPIVAPRGRILDRNGALLATNRPCFILTAISEQMTEKTLPRLAACLNCELETLKQRMEKESKGRNVVIAENVPWETVVLLEEASALFPGIRLSVRHRRHYLYGETTAHILGYVGSISEDELARLPKGVYRINDFIGKDGLERTYESRLRGADGVCFFETDARMRRIRLASQPKGQAPVPGEDLVLTIDVRLQEAAHKALGDESGAVVAMVPKTGEILCMVSHPIYDPNRLIPPTDSPYVRSLFQDAKHPLLNRAVNSAYSPGSTFKPVVAAAGLAEKKITPSTVITCNGQIQVGQRTFHCYHGRTHGPLTLNQALCYSCNCFFYQLGLRLGAREIDRYAQLFGLGHKTGVRLPSERHGTIPSFIWQGKQRGGWFQGDTVNLSIGQGYLTVTPLQMVRLYSTLVNGGFLYRPSLVKYAIPSGSDVFQKFEPEAIHRIDISSSELAAIRLGLWEVVNHPRGTGRRCKLDFPEVAGKTGTVQVVSTLDEEEKPKELQDHAWFIAMVPAEDPDIVLAVFLEHGGKGGESAAPMAQQILKGYFASTLEVEGEEDII